MTSDYSNAAAKSIIKVRFPEAKELANGTWGQRWRIEKDSMPSIIVRRSLAHFRLQDEAVPGRIHVAFQHTERDLDKLRIAEEIVRHATTENGVTSR